MAHIKTDATGKGYGNQGKTPPHQKPAVPKSGGGTSSAHGKAKY
jgi:hypothetical protein